MKIEQSLKVKLKNRPYNQDHNYQTLLENQRNKVNL